MLSTVILSIVSILQHIKFEYLYLILVCYLVLLWVSFAVWLWKDTEKRYENAIIRNIVWVFVSCTFIFGLIFYLLIRPKQKDEDTYWINLERDYLTYETYGMGKCSICNEQLRPEFLFCPACGTTLREKCPECLQVIDMKWKICPYCAYKKEEKEIVPEEIPHISISERVYTVYKNVRIRLQEILVVVRKRATEFLGVLHMHEEEKVEKKVTSTKMKKKITKAQQKEIPPSFLEKQFLTLKRLFVVEEKATTRK